MPGEKSKMPGHCPSLAFLIVCVSFATCGFHPATAFPQTKRTKSDANINKIGHCKITSDLNFYSQLVQKHTQQQQQLQQLRQTASQASAKSQMSRHRNL
jgi:hypothetical protein